jgi:YgiT-type zinc finger domain-containing protein
MGQSNERCTFCLAPGLEPATTTWQHSLGGVTVTIDGIPAEHCSTCGQTGVKGKVGIPIDAAIQQILIATGAMLPPDPEAEAALREENRELARKMGQGDTLLDEPAGAGSPTR